MPQAMREFIDQDSGNVSRGSLQKRGPRAFAYAPNGALHQQGQEARWLKTPESSTSRVRVVSSRGPPIYVAALESQTYEEMRQADLQCQLWNHAVCHDPSQSISASSAKMLKRRRNRQNKREKKQSLEQLKYSQEYGGEEASPSNQVLPGL